MAKNTEKTPKEKRLKNLKPAWKKGDPSPNPKGRPEGARNFKTILEEIFSVLADQETSQELKTINPKIKTNEDLFAAKLFYDAMNGDSASKNIIIDRYYGKMTEKTEHSGQISVDHYTNLSKDELKKELDKLGLSDKLFDK